MKWFGAKHDAPAWDYAEPVATPVGEKCKWCGEPILEGEAGVCFPQVYIVVGGIELREWLAYHLECHLRQVLGSYGHLTKQCSCHGGSLEDPPELSRRQAALLAYLTFMEQS